MPLERITITLKRNGEFKGASATDYDGEPVPLTNAALTALFPTLNTAAIAGAAKFDAANATLENVRTAYQRNDINAAETLDLIRPAVRAALLTDRQIERARIESELAAKQAELDAFGTA